MIHYSKSGEGNTIVLIHGFCENSTCFSEQVFFLRKNFSVLTPDLPGFGDSAPAAHTTMESLADAVHEVLVHEGIRSCVMIGHSMGGYVTLAFAEKYPQMLKGFGLMHSTAVADTEERRQKRDQAIRVIQAEGPETYVRNFIPPLFSKEFKNTDKINELVQEGLKSSAEGLIQALQAMKSRPDRTGLLAAISLPVFFAIGKEDTIIPEKDMFAQAASCKTAQVCYLSEAAHMGFIEDAGKTSLAMSDFAAECFSSPD